MTLIQKLGFASYAEYWLYIKKQTKKFNIE